MELWDVYDKDRILTGETMVRGDKAENGAYHLVVHVCIFNSKGEMLIQQRQPFKSGWSNMWDVTVGGSAVSGDTSRIAAERETFEEIGYTINFENVRPSLTLNFEDGFDDIYLVTEDLDINCLHLQYEEVQQVKWATMSEIISMIEGKGFIPYRKNLIELLFEMRDNMGAIS